MVVERELAKAGEPSRLKWPTGVFGESLGMEKQSGGTIINQLKRLGASCDWDRTAFTMSGAPNAPADEDGNFHDAVSKFSLRCITKA